MRKVHFSVEIFSLNFELGQNIHVSSGRKFDADYKSVKTKVHLILDSSIIYAKNCFFVLWVKNIYTSVGHLPFGCIILKNVW